MKNKIFLAAAFTLAGTAIGAGILGLPYAFSKSGFLIGVFWLIVLGGVMTLTNLCLGEVSLRTKGTHHLLGYANKYLGKKGKKLMFFAIIFGIYSALLAYLIGEGQSLSKLFMNIDSYSILFGIGFWALMSLLLYGGIERLKKIESWGVIAIIGIVFVLFFWLLPGVEIDNLSYVNTGISNLFLPFGIVIFALLAFTSVPELRRIVKGNEKLLKRAILAGSLIPIALYLIFSFSFVGSLGESVKEVATISFGGSLGKLMNVLGIFTMLTSYFVLSFALKDIFVYDLKKKKLVFVFISLVPLLLYLGVSFFEFAGFVKILGIGGVVSGGLTGILILLMNIKAKKKGNRKAEYSIPINWWLIGILSLIFIVGVVFELLGV